MMFAWNESNFELTEKLWKEGLSAAAIAGRLGNGCTRSAVIGKIHRAGLARNRDTASPTRKPNLPNPRVRAAPSMPRIIKAPGATSPRVIINVPALTAPPVLNKLSVLDIDSSTCKWPIGDVMSPDFTFCGHGPRPNSPYCEYHDRLAYQPLQDRRHRKLAYG